MLESIITRVPKSGTCGEIYGQLSLSPSQLSLLLWLIMFLSANLRSCNSGDHGNTQYLFLGTKKFNRTANIGNRGLSFTTPTKRWSIRRKFNKQFQGIVRWILNRLEYILNKDVPIFPTSPRNSFHIDFCDSFPLSVSCGAKWNLKWGNCEFPCANTKQICNSHV